MRLSIPEQSEQCAKVLPLQRKTGGFQTFVILLLLLSALIVVFLIAQGYAATRPVQDMVQYWAAARLVTQNPYSLRLVWPLEKSVGARIGMNDATFVNRNPPWSLLFFLPLRFLSYRTAYALWTIFSLLIIAGCARKLWQLYTPEPSLLPAVIALLFGPTICLLTVGQSTILALLGITIFLSALSQKRDWVAGAALLLITVKPHIALIFLLALALWSVYRKRWAIWGGAAAALAMSTLIILSINSAILSQYSAFVQMFSQERLVYPNLGGLVYTATGIYPLAFLPEVLAVLWLSVYWWQRRSEWSWRTHGMVVLLVSVTCSYYSFAYDEIILLPALLGAAALGDRRLFFAGFVLVNAGYAFFLWGPTDKFGVNYMFLSWTASAWLLTYALSRRLAPDGERLTVMVEFGRQVASP